MKRTLLCGLSLCVFFLVGYGKQSAADNLGSKGQVTVEGNDRSLLVDPENPEIKVDPGEGAFTTGDLRIDFVSSLTFPSAEITKTHRRFDSLAQLFHSETTARGYYIQVSDLRSDTYGWNLTLSQETQFTSTIIQNLEEQSLKGSVLSFDNGWANSSSNSKTPTVSRDTLAINEMNTAYTVAVAGENEGKGVWTIAFGASIENRSNQENTLNPVTNAKGQSVMDVTFNKQSYSNSAVSLTIPEASKIYPVQYTTTLTWRLEAVPTE
ncbi:WxL domain-containing protein [Enterococcus sp. 5H]|uniref:WxL domain-containing protein n=1 Tax=Enterococcus sp. 5H TaxID=1229490 RepID=UPI002304142B|nr:WxL domain-containing protein [Enterococcus sp. 5H]MDA9472550.1 hypothetical protein [Enterococcus sp. 5H]